jgi:para-nitrobenzyl esterase
MSVADNSDIQAFVEVPTAEGTVRGARRDGVWTFRGIPYAAPPIGPWRFAPPEPPTIRSETMDALEYGHISAQDLDPLPLAIPPTQENFFFPDAIASEDCLSLNVWTTDTDGKAPVLVWIHGGAFMYGSGTGSWTDGTAHAKNSRIVVVSLNYRLGIAGGLYLGDIEPGCANFGLLDQIAALRWIKENIAAFGGDPDNVTIGGQSAGAMSVAALLASPPAKGLFKRAIVESGHLRVTTSIEEATAARNIVLGQFGLEAADPQLLSKLRDLNLLRLLGIGRVNGLAVRTFPLVEDGISIVTNAVEEIADGFANGVDLLIGTNTAEDRLFALTGWTADEGMSLRDDLAGVILDPEKLDNAVALYSEIDEKADVDRRHVFATDHGWGTPCRELALAHSNAGNTVFHYEFEWRSPALGGKVGAAHLVELPFAFGNLSAPGTGALLGDNVAEDAGALAVSSGMATAWGAFVSHGTPNPSPLPEWPAFTDEVRSTMVINVNSRVEVDRNAERLDFWANTNSARPLSTVSDAVD